jgi:hypothetical protein
VSELVVCHDDSIRSCQLLLATAYFEIRPWNWVGFHKFQQQQQQNFFYSIHLRKTKILFIKEKLDATQ